MNQLRDIRGLDPMPWWPPAPGWGLVLGGILLLVALMVAFGLVLRRRHRPVARRWRTDAHELLLALQARLHQGDDARVLAGELSELLRRIAMVRFGRRACAGLVGEAWLTWLEAHDPNGFQWRTNGLPLLDLPYAPAGSDMKAEVLEPLIQASEAWITTDPVDGAPRAPVRAVRPTEASQSSQSAPIRVDRVAGGGAHV